jgi:methionyl-tRNA synthetase
MESNELSIQPEVRKNEVLSFLRGNLSEAVVTKKSALGNPYVKGALKDFSISRTSVSWGIPVPGNENHTIYVWFDALINYMSAIGYGSDDPEQQKKFAHYWPADLHLVGKEIIRFHCVYWPAVLLAAGLPLPKAITAHGWLLFEESKMSKSRGNIVRTETILDAFGEHYSKELTKQNELSGPTKSERDLFASDVLRYFLLREIPFGQDGSFSFDALVTRYNADLANGYGNLVSRTLNLIGQYSSHQQIPELPSSPLLVGTNSQPLDVEHIGSITDQGIADTKLVQFATIFAARDGDKLWERSDFTSIINLCSGAIRVVDSYLSEWKPWKLIKSSEVDAGQKFTECMYTAAEATRIITALLHPFMPFATAKVWAQLGLGDIEEAARKGELKNLEWGGLKSGTKLGELAPIFPRAPKELIQLMTDMENNTNTPSKPEPSKLVDERTTNATPVPTDPTHPGAPPRTSAIEEPNPGAQVGGSHAISTERASTPSHTEAPASGAFATSAAGSNIPDTPQIAIDDFVKVDLRVAQIVVAERIPKADKLLRLEVDLGYEKRQILAGIAAWYTPEELIGRRIVVITNLAPRKMRGLESHGMLLAASNGEDGKPVLATFGEEIALGSRLK